MTIDSVIIKPYQNKGHNGIDIQISDEHATVQDYYQALDEYILSGSYQRQRAITTSCEGCDICCQERAPLTSVDVMVLKEQVAPELTINDFLKRYGYININGPVVDISLARDGYERCLFLSPETGKCRHYQTRPLVCRTYICTPLSPRAKKLRQSVVNSGMDELVRLTLTNAEDGKYPVHEAEDPDVTQEDWTESMWTGKSLYSQLKLRDILTDQLWTELRKGE